MEEGSLMKSHDGEERCGWVKEEVMVDEGSSAGTMGWRNTAYFIGCKTKSNRYS